jgi:hypothetical protein
MKTTIERIRFSQLWNNEFLQVVIYIIDICSKYDNKKLYLDKSYEELSSFKPLLETIGVSERKNEKLSNMSRLDVERDMLIKCINKVVNNYNEVDIPEIQKHAELLFTLLDKHQSKTIPLANRTGESERIQKLETEYKSSSAIQASFQALGLYPVVTRLFAANKEYNILFQEYIREKSLEERIDMVDLRKKCTKALGQYFDAIQYCAFAYEENDYQPLINELKQISAYYNQQLKARATRCKNGKKVLEEPPIELPEIKTGNK